MNAKLSFLLLAVLASLGLGRAMAAPDPPNVVMIISDDQTWTDFGFMGHSVVRTPHLDRLASESLLFPHGYVTMSLCRPSLASMITGLYPHQSKIANNYPVGTPMLDHPPYLNSRTGEYWRLHQQMIQPIDFVPTLPSLLGEWGYKSLQTGKWWEGHFGRGGFTSGMTLGTPSQVAKTTVAWNWRGGDRGIAIGRDVGLKPIYDFIEQVEDRPFFIWYAPAMPHNPHNPPQRLLEKYLGETESIHVARYWAMCEWFDETCGELLDYLDQNKLADNTLVVFVVDNGYMPKPDAPGANYDRSKGSAYDGGIRTPIILRWPGRIEAGRDETLVSSVDLVPTILTACGLKPTDKMPGLDLLDPEALAQRKAIFGAIYTHAAADLDRPETSLKARWGIKGNWKLIVPGVAYVEDPQVRRRYELYDLEADPHEQNNLASAHPDRVEQLYSAINQWWPAK
jgi:uncharacterized sulfatase